MISIGIPIRNNFHFPEKLLYSLEKYTDKSLVDKLIIIDDGSSPEIEKSGLKLNIFNTLHLIRNKESIGFPAACNQIIRAADSDFICILNSDTFVTPNWLNYLYDVINNDKYIGAIGPSTSYANDPQCQRDICGKRYEMDEDAIIKYAKKLAKLYKEPVKVGPTLTGFCMLLRKEALDQTGLFDEQFGLGSFEEADLFTRMQNKGWSCMWVPYAYVHHYGKGTFVGEKINWKKLWAENQKRFEQKWENKLKM